ncbi:alpha/beta hydrolase [Aurantivibrio infirmus]
MVNSLMRVFPELKTLSNFCFVLLRFVIATLCLMGLLNTSSLAQDLTQDTDESPGLSASKQTANILQPCSQVDRSGDADIDVKEIDSILSTGAYECGRLQVPEDPENPDGRSIFLNIVRLPAVSSQSETDPLFLFSGGPGEAATDLAPSLPNLFFKVNRTRDIVLVDQRGTGKSNPLNCDRSEFEDYSLSLEEHLSIQDQQLKKCLDGYDANLAFYTTPYAVDDIDRVRRALGYEKINLWGGSYGTRAALVYARRHPQSVRTITLDAVAPIGIALPYNALADADQAFKYIFENCTQDPKCRARFPNLLEKTQGFIKDLDRSPRKIEIEHPLTQKKIEIELSGQMFASVIRLILYTRDVAPTLPLIIDSAINGDFRGFAVILTIAEQVPSGISVGLHQTILCAEDVTQFKDKIFSADDSVLQLDAVTSSRRICEYWPQGSLPENYFDPVKSDAPVLMLSGSLDPVTPPRWAELAGETLSDDLHVVVPGAHHGSTPLGCVKDLVAEFIEAGSHAQLDTKCVENIKPVAQFISPAGPSMSASDKQSRAE